MHSGTESAACQALAPRIFSSVLNPKGHLYTGICRLPCCRYAGRLSLPRTRMSWTFGSSGLICVLRIARVYFPVARDAGNVHVPEMSIRVVDVNTGLSSSMFWMMILPTKAELIDLPTATSWLSIRIPRKVCSSRARKSVTSSPFGPGGQTFATIEVMRNRRARCIIVAGPNGGRQAVSAPSSAWRPAWTRRMSPASWPRSEARPSLSRSIALAPTACRSR